MAHAQIKSKPKSTAKSKSDYVSIHFALHETGWAEPLDDGTYRIDNIPLVDHLNIDDVVTVTPGDPKCCARPIVDQVLRSVYPVKVGIAYRPDAKGGYDKNYRLLRSAMADIDAKLEGYAGGFAAVAAKDLAILEATLSTLPFRVEIESSIGDDTHGDDA